MNDELTSRLFKRLTSQNWRQHDTTADIIVQMHKDGTTSKINDDEWATFILEIDLTPDVPENVRNLFEVAQGVLCYGSYFYPLYTLGHEQIFRVLESALRHKCVELGKPGRADTFSRMLNWLREYGRLPDYHYVRWDAARKLRNMASHADRQSLVDPTWAVRTLSVAAELINELFASMPKTMGAPNAAGWAKKEGAADTAPNVVSPLQA